MDWHDLLATLTGFCLLWQLQIVLRNLLALRHLPVLRRNPWRRPPAEQDPITIILSPSPESRELAATLRDRWENRPLEIVVPELREGEPEVVDEIVRILPVGEPAPGTDATFHAYERAAHGARGRWLLFLRSDLDLDAHALTGTIGHAEERDLALLSVYPKPRFTTTWERLVEPLVLDGLPRDGTRAGQGEGACLSQGGFLLVSREALDDVGGLRDLAVRPGGYMDFQVIARLRAASHATQCVLAGELVQQRGGANWKEAWKERVAWYTASAARALPARAWAIPLLPLILAYGLLLTLPFLAAPIALYWLVSGGFGTTDYGTFVMAVTAMGLAVVHRLSTAERFSMEPSLRTLYVQPITGLLVTAMMSAAWLRLLRGLHEKDRALEPSETQEASPVEDDPSPPVDSRQAGAERPTAHLEPGPKPGTSSR